ncbi:MAG: hypothetical protein IT301_06235 [Dehalococcoidia bacterium]|nr:hypothetical protein [Dehalococcoidia bacterium]
MSGAASRDTDTIWVHSHVSAKLGEPYVVLSWGANAAQMTPAEALTHAAGIVEAAHAAIYDAYLAKAMGGIDAQVGAILLLLRNAREGGDRFNSFKAGHAAPPPVEE